MIYKQPDGYKFNKIIFLTDDFTITGATAEMQPILTLIADAGGAEVNINGVEFSTSNEEETTYILDCENKIITKNGYNYQDISLHYLNSLLVISSVCEI